MGAVCNKENKKSSSNSLNSEYDGDFKLRRITTINETLEKNFPKGAYFYNKQEVK